MPTEPVNEAELRKQLDYYKSLTDELAGENLRLDYMLSGLKQELVQKKQGFELLSKLQRTLGSDSDRDVLFRSVIEAVNTSLIMEKSVILYPQDDGRLKPIYSLGFTKNAEAMLLDQTFQLPERIYNGTDSLIINKSVEVKEEFVVKMQKAFELPYFICTAILVGKQTMAVLVSGRTQEVRPLFPPLDQNHLDSLKALAGLIAATIENFGIRTLKELDRLKGEFFANISHEFRTPIALTIGPIETLLSGRLGSFDPEVHRHLEVMLGNQRRLLHLINQILDLAKLESGQLKLKTNPVNDFHGYLLQVLEPFYALAENKSLELRSRLDQNIQSLTLLLDLEKFDQIIHNLLSNAFKFTQRGHIELSTQLIDGQLQIVVNDTGQGIRSDQMDVIFDRFRQAEGSVSFDIAGTGIGLSLVQELVKLHGGQVLVDSEFGKGTRFTLLFPLDKILWTGGPTENIQRIKRKMRSEPERMAPNTFSDAHSLNSLTAKNHQKDRSTILYADDNSDLRYFVHNLLKDEFNVYLAGDGEEALVLTEKINPDLILSDLMMPKLNGSQLLKAIRRHPIFSSLPFILLTAKTSTKTRVEELESGADDYLSKPFSEIELVARCRNLVKMRKQQMRIKRDLIAARDIQRNLMPPFEQDLQTAQLEVLYVPCDELSGDYFDCFFWQDSYYFYLADITSHGVASAQVTYVVKGIFQNIVATQPQALELKQLMQKFARQYVTKHLEQAVALQIIRYHPLKRQIEYALSGSPEAVIVNQNKLRFVDCETSEIIMNGIFDDNSKIFTASLNLVAGDRVFIFTDGCYEFNSKIGNGQFGIQRFTKMLAELPDLNWRETFIHRLRDSSRDNSFTDDLSVLRLAVK